MDAITRITADEVAIGHRLADVAAAPTYDPELAEEQSYYVGLYGFYGYLPFSGIGYVDPTLLDNPDVPAAHPVK